MAPPIKFKITAFLLWLSVAIASILLGYKIIESLLGGAASVANWASQMLSRPDLKDIITQRVDGFMLKALSITFVITAVAWSFLLYYFRPARLQMIVQTLATYFYHAFQNQWHTYRRWPIAAQIAGAGLVIFYLTTRIYMMLTVPLERDESMSWYYFIKTGPLVAATYYPYPNNHPLYSILAWPFSYLPLPLMVKLRLPVVIMGLVALWLFVKMCVRHFGLWGALVAGFVFLSLFPIGRFTVYGRGYILMVIIATALCILYQKSAKANNKIPWTAIAFLQIAGLYTIPVFIYFTAGSTVIYGLYFIKSNRITIQKYLLHLLFIAGIVALLYLPFIITSGGLQGFKHIVYSGYDPSPILSIKQSIGEGLRSWNIFTLLYRFHYIWVVLVLFITGIGYVVWYLTKARSTPAIPFLTFFLYLLLLPFLAHIAQGHYIAERVFSPSVLALVFGLVSLGCISKNKWSTLWLWVLFVGAVINYSSYFLVPTYPDAAERTSDSTSALFAQKMLDAGATSSYIDSYWYRPVVELYFHEYKKPMQVTHSVVGSPSFKAYTTSQHYDALILPTHSKLVPAAGFVEKMVRPDAVLYLY